MYKENNLIKIEYENALYYIMLCMNVLYLLGLPAP